MTGLSKGSAVLLIPLILAVSGCETFKEARLYGECANKTQGGGECKVGAEVKWERPLPPPKPGKIMAGILAASEALPDAAQYVLNVSGSTIPYPSSGTMTVRLTNSATGAVVASRVFEWVRSGAVIRARYPDAVNDWAYARGGTADTIAYELTRFYSSYGAGMQRIAAASTYEGATIASYSSQFNGGASCTTYPSPRLCPGN